MNHTAKPISLNLFLTGSYPCSYLPEQKARSQAVAKADGVDANIYSQLMRLGFRRSGLYVYRPQCDQCKACISVRLVVDEFKPTRTQHRLHKKHTRELQAYCSNDLSWRDEYYELYLNYQAQRHPDNLDQSTPKDFTEFLLSSHVNTQLVEFRDHNNVLRMVSVFDILDDGLSAMYTFYDCNYMGSLGTYAVLWLSDVCKFLNLPYLYLGYWIKDSQKMAYKINFQPLDYYHKAQWQRTQPGTTNLR